MDFPPLIPSFSVLLERLSNISGSTLALLCEMAAKKKQQRNTAWLVAMTYILYFPQKAKQQLRESKWKWAEDACPLWLVVFFCMCYWCSFCLCDCCLFLINWLMVVLAMFLWGLPQSHIVHYRMSNNMECSNAFHNLLVLIKTGLLQLTWKLKFLTLKD